MFWRYAWLILLQSLVYGLGNPLTKLAYDTISPLWMLATRFTLATAVMMLIWGRSIVDDLRTVPVSVWMASALFTAGSFVSCNYGLLWTSATNVGFIMSLPLVFAPILSIFLLKRPYPWKHLPLQLAALVGLALLCSDGGQLRFGAGDGLVLITALCIAGVLVTSETALNTMHATSLAAAQAAVTAAVCLALAVIFDDPAALPQVSLQSWAVVVYLALTCTILAYVIQAIALRHLTSRAVSLLQCTQPLATAAFSFAVLGEKLGAVGLAGAAVIVACLILDSFIK
jgi:drug/metabolite transporter (DMT)-like permease